jgi:hypothetical protein
LGDFGFEQTVETHGDPTYGTINVTGTLILYTPTVTLDTTKLYKVTLPTEGYYDDTEMRTEYSWSFGTQHIYLPIIFKGSDF